MAAYARRQFAGGAVTTTVPLAVGSSDSSFTLASSTNWPDGSVGPFIVVIDQSSPEKILCSSRTGLVVTVAASGRGYDGTSAVSHVAGSQIQCVHGAQDDDEANQVVSAVLGQSGAAKGDILYMLSAAGPNTLQRLGIGANGSVLSAASGVPAYSAAGAPGMLLQSAGSAVPTWIVPPGSLLATQQYAPASRAVYPVSTALVAVDTTNLTLSFTVPASGKVDVDVEISYLLTISATATDLSLGLLNHSGGAQIGITKVPIQNGISSSTDIAIAKTRFHLTGLTPGALQVDLAAATSSSVTCDLLAQGVTGAATSSQSSDALMQAFASI